MDNVTPPPTLDENLIRPASRGRKSGYRSYRCNQPHPGRTATVITHTTKIKSTDRDAQITEFGKYLYKIPEAMDLLSMGRSAIYEQIRSGRLRSVQQGRSRLISAAAIRDYVALLEREAREAVHYGKTA